MHRRSVKRGKIIRCRRNNPWHFYIEENQQRNPFFVYRKMEELGTARRHWKKTKKLLMNLGRSWPYGLSG